MRNMREIVVAHCGRVRDVSHMRQRERSAVLNSFLFGKRNILLLMCVELFFNAFVVQLLNKYNWRPTQ